MVFLMGCLFPSGERGDTQWRGVVLQYFQAASPRQFSDIYA